MSAPGTTVPLLPNACPEPPESLLLEVVANQMVGSALEASSMHPKQLEPPCLQTGACHGMTTFLDYRVGAFPPVQLIWAKIKTAQWAMLVSLRPAGDNVVLVRYSAPLSNA